MTTIKASFTITAKSFAFAAVLMLSGVAAVSQEIRTPAIEIQVAVEGADVSQNATMEMVSWFMASKQVQMTGQGEAAKSFSKKHMINAGVFC